MLPVSTYRLQLHAGFRFADAKEIVDYLVDLGITHVYASPYLAAEPGSTHGYNLVDPSRLNPEIGDDADYIAWTDRLAARGMGHIVDVVPNHMAASTVNVWWNDLLENGPASRYAPHFDVEWRPPKEALHDRVLLPILGAQYGEVLERGELRLVRNGGTFTLHYYDRELPVNPRTLAGLLGRIAHSIEDTMSPDDPARQDFESIVMGLERLPPRTSRAPEERLERAREKEVLKRRIATLCEDPRLAAAVDAEVVRTNGTPGDPRSFDALDELIVAQAYRLAYWRVATEEINYRRFFDVNELAAVRMEEPAVFEDMHRLLIEHVAAGRIDGLRLDHTDGLHDPAGYFTALRNAFRVKDLYIVAEKILARSEDLPRTWAIDGTTGYDFLAQASALFIDPQAEGAFTRLFEEVTGDTRTFAAHVLDAKRSILDFSLSSEVNMLALRLERIAMSDRRSRDFTLATLRRAVSETIAAFGVYRTYVQPNGGRSPTDDQTIRRAVHLARRRNPEVSPSVFEFLRDVLLFDRQPADEEARARRAEFVMRFQQLTGPVAAKGVEDTTFYTYVRFVALNEVGGQPERFGTNIAELHTANADRRTNWPRSMTSTSTHDTKRGEDVRARLAVLSEIPDEWRAWLESWRDRAAPHRTQLEEETAPTPSDEYHFFQTLVGALPLAPELLADRERLADRLVAFGEKAAREAKQRTSWLAPDEPYEAALRRFIRGVVLDDALFADVASKVDGIAPFGASNGLAQVVLKVASPGIPDTYQGCETWDFRLVDPDNRGLVDYEALRAAQRSLEGASVASLREGFRDGRLKMHVLTRALRLRRALPAVFVDGSYLPLEAGEEIFAFAREHAQGRVVAAVTRFPLRVARAAGAKWACGAAWNGRSIPVPDGRWRDVLTGATHGSSGGVAARALFAELPVTLLVAE